MSFKTTLYRAAEIADITHINGQEQDELCWCPDLEWREPDSGQLLTFPDQEINVVEGKALAMGYVGGSDQEEQASFAFFMQALPVPMQFSDIQAHDLPNTPSSPS